MDFSLSDDQRAILDAAGKLAQSFTEEYWQKVDTDVRFPKEYWHALRDHGMLGISVPEAYGGLGRGLLDLTLCAEALSNSPGGMAGGGVFVAGPVFGGFMFLRHGTAAQKEKYLPGIVRGDIWAGAFTEANAGSNVSDIKTSAKHVDGTYIIRGQKMFISNLASAQHVVISARTGAREDAKKTQGVSVLIADLPSLQLNANPFRKLGTHWMDTSAVFIDDLTVPDDQVIGEAGNAWTALYDVLNPERIVLAASAVGAGLWLVRRAAEYTMQRKIWRGTPLGAHQAVQFPLAEAKIMLDAARLKVYEAAWLYDQQSSRCGVAAASAKYSAAHAAITASDRALQAFGGAGYIVESGIERHWRDLRLNRIAPVTDEMALGFIGQHDLGMPRSY